MRVKTLIIERELKDLDEIKKHDTEVEIIVSAFGGQWIGCGTYLPTLTRDWQYEIEPRSAHLVAKSLINAGYSVQIFGPPLH